MFAFLSLSLLTALFLSCYPLSLSLLADVRLPVCELLLRSAVRGLLAEGHQPPAPAGDDDDDGQAVRGANRGDVPASSHALAQGPQ